MVLPQRLWPLVIAICVAFCNTDVVVVPTLKTWGIASWLLVTLVLAIATVELIWWFWFWRWVIRLVAEVRQIRATVQFGKELGQELKYQGYVDRVLKHLETTYAKAIAPDNHVNRKIRRWGYLALFVLGIEPTPGGRAIGVIFCGACNWRRGLWVLIFGNVFHVLSVIWGWNLLFRLLGH